MTTTQHNTPEELNIQEQPSRHDAIASAVEYMYGSSALEDDDINGRALLRQNLEAVYDIDPEVSASMASDELLHKAIEYDTLKLRYESAKQLDEEFYEIQDELRRNPARSIKDTSNYAVEQGLDTPSDFIDADAHIENFEQETTSRIKRWLERLSQHRELTEKEQDFMERGVEFLDEEIVNDFHETNEDRVEDGLKKYDEPFRDRKDMMRDLIQDAGSYVIAEEASEEYHKFMGDDDTVRELEYYTRGIIREGVQSANENPEEVGGRGVAACVLWALAYERDLIKRPDIVVGALNRIAINGDFQWDDMEESVKAAICEDLMDVEEAQGIVELVANYGKVGHYPYDTEYVNHDGEWFKLAISPVELGLAVGTLAKLDDLELEMSPKDLSQ